MNILKDTHVLTPILESDTLEDANLLLIKDAIILTVLSSRPFEV